MKIKTACLVTFLACSIISWADGKQSVSAKQLFYAQVKAVKAPGQPHPKPGPVKKEQGKDGVATVQTSYHAPTTGLKYQIIQRLSDGTEAPVNLNSSFQSGDHIRLSFESNMKGYLYVVQQGSTGNWTVLFPDPRINDGKNTIDSGNQYVVPASGWFFFDENPGTERLMVFLSQTPLDTLPGMTRSADPGPPTVNQSIVDELNNIKNEGIRSRALVFEKDNSPANDGSRPSPAAYVVNQNGKAVVTEILLTHN